MGSERQLRCRKRIDDRHERTPARLAFEKWRDAEYPLGEAWLLKWDDKAIDGRRWPPFLAGWNAALIRQAG